MYLAIPGTIFTVTWLRIWSWILLYPIISILLPWAPCLRSLGFAFHQKSSIWLKLPSLRGTSQQGAKCYGGAFSHRPIGDGSGEPGRAEGRRYDLCCVQRCSRKSIEADEWGERGGRGGRAAFWFDRKKRLRLEKRTKHPKRSQSQAGIKKITKQQSKIPSNKKLQTIQISILS